MRCEGCEQQIGLATVCPYCGWRRKGPAREDARKQSEEPKRAQGGFRGRLDPDDDAVGGSAGGSSWIGALLRLVADPATPRMARLVLIGATLYILSPIDFLPGGIIPVIGWIDDLIIGWLAWTYLKPHLKRHRR